MKKVILLFISVLIYSCSSESIENEINGLPCNYYIFEQESTPDNNGNIDTVFASFTFYENYTGRFIRNSITYNSEGVFVEDNIDKSFTYTYENGEGVFELEENNNIITDFEIEDGKMYIVYDGVRDYPFLTEQCD